MPSTWQATAILHPFSPPPANVPPPNTPFFELCVATIAFVEGVALSVQIVGSSGRTWWYAISNSGTEVSTDQGANFSPVDMGWTLPTTQWTSNPRFFITAPLNWMEAQTLDWWTQPVPNSPAATWFWFNNVAAEGNGYPFRTMFGAPPPAPDQGDPNQLAFFQNFSFTYFPTFEEMDNPPIGTWTEPVIPGFALGNPESLQLPIWDTNFGMISVMTPVDATSSPLPTYILYHWASDEDYLQLSDRAQNSTMSYQFNPALGIKEQVALMFGPAPAGTTPPPYAASSFIYTIFEDKPTACAPLTADGLPLAAEAPDWTRTSGEGGQIWAVATDNGAICPNQRIMIFSELFPPAPGYPQGTYLWTWYSPFPGSDGTQARPVTFMQSASQISVGTSLALADYFQYETFREPIPPGFFDIPPACLPPGGKKAKKSRARGSRSRSTGRRR